MSIKIPNSNPWIKPNQIDYFSLDNFNPDYQEDVKEGVDLDEAGDIDINVTLTLRRALDAFKSGTPHKLRNYSTYKNSQELLDLSYKDLNSYVSNLDKQELEEVYGASPWDIQVIKDYLKNNNAVVKDINPERRTIEFNISAKNFKAAFTNGDLLVNQDLSYINQNLKPSDSYLYAQGESSDVFSEALIGFKINDLLPASNPNTTNEAPSEANKQVDTSFYPQELGSAYNFPDLDNSSGGEGVRIGLVGSGGNQAMLGWHQSPQYHQYLKNQGIDPDSVLPVQSVDKNEPNTDDVSEQMLDISILTSIAPNAQIIASPYGDYEELIYENKIDIISSSMGAFPNYSLWSPSQEELFVDAILRGITVVIAAGDQGTLNIDGGGEQLIPFGEPLSSATDGSSAVLSVGGTSFSPELNKVPFVFNRNKLDELNRTMVVDGNAYDSLTGLIGNQSMWNQFMPIMGTTINGVFYDDLTLVDSQYLIANRIGSSGSWNSDDSVLNAGYQINNLGGDMDGYARKFPDISVLAGGNTANGTSNWHTINMYDESTDTYMFSINGGTSSGAPLTAGLLAVIAGDLKKQNGPQSKIGFINPLLYEVYASDSRDDLFIDVPEGSNNANVFKLVDEADWEKKYVTQFDNNGPLLFLNGTGPGGSLDTSLSQTGYGFDDASGLGSLDGKELLNYLTEIHGSL